MKLHIKVIVWFIWQSLQGPSGRFRQWHTSKISGSGQSQVRCSIGLLWKGQWVWCTFVAAKSGVDQGNSAYETPVRLVEWHWRWWLRRPRQSVSTPPSRRRWCWEGQTAIVSVQTLLTFASTLGEKVFSNEGQRSILESRDWWCFPGSSNKLPGIFRLRI